MSSSVVVMHIGSGLHFSLFHTLCSNPQTMAAPQCDDRVVRVSRCSDWHGGWVCVNTIQQHTPLVWHARRAGTTSPAVWTTCVLFVEPKTYGWMCTLHMVETMKGLVMSCLNSVYAAGRALSTCCSTVSLKGSSSLASSKCSISTLRHLFLSTAVAVPRSYQSCILQPWGERGEKMTLL